MYENKLNIWISELLIYKQNADWELQVHLSENHKMHIYTLGIMKAVPYTVDWLTD